MRGFHEEDIEQEYDENEQDSEVAEKQAELDRLAILRGNYVESLQRIVDEILDEACFERLSTSSLRVHKKQLRRHFTQFENADALYRQHNTVCTSAIFVNMENNFMLAMTKIDEKLSEACSNEARSNEARSNDHSSQSSTVIEFENRLPQIIQVETMLPPQLTKFSGNPADWPAFRDLFLAEVHNKKLDPVTKLLYLQGACTEKAAITLGPWGPTADNYQAAWDTLIQAYNDDYHVIHSILGRMHAVRKQDRENHDSLRSVLDSLHSGTRQLETMATTPEIFDQMWIHHCKQRLPRYTLDAWERHRNRDGINRLPTLSQFKHFLDVKSKGRREFEEVEIIGHNKQNNSRAKVEQVGNQNPNNAHGNYDRSNNTSGNNRQRGQSNRYMPYDKTQRQSTQQTRSQGNQGEFKPATHNECETLIEPGRCIVPGCTRKHPTYICDEFKKLDVNARWGVVNKFRLCKCCLNTGHMAHQCTRSGCSLCPEADERTKHHYRLCNKPQSNNPTNNRVNPFSTPVSKATQ